MSFVNMLAPFPPPKDKSFSLLISDKDYSVQFVYSAADDYNPKCELSEKLD